MDDHQYLSTLDVTQVAWTLKVRAIRMWILSNGRGEAVRHNLILLDSALRQVKGFSSEWWQLMKTLTWFYNYWLSQQHENDDFFVYNEDDLEDIVDMLPNAIDLGIEKEIVNMKIQFEHFI
ncbi:protein EARLY RESPONSIVE TO DEHYDRATION 15-like [Apium graveolens]|uniref:protein EARLY RESPONSIVE TO DEHYDRATION 15-like n=1 Tax=Apium graveolens TaxID=4045 RepID=UPI003D790835